MSYEQALAHSHNHRKDRFYQQCSGYSGSQHEYASNHVSPEKEAEHSRESMAKILAEQHVYPIYVAQCGIGIWYLVPSNHIGGNKIGSEAELRAFAADYA